MRQSWLGSNIKKAAKKDLRIKVVGPKGDLCKWGTPCFSGVDLLTSLNLAKFNACHKQSNAILGLNIKFDTDMQSIILKSPCGGKKPMCLFAGSGPLNALMGVSQTKLMEWLVCCTWASPVQFWTLHTSKNSDMNDRSDIKQQGDRASTGLNYANLYQMRIWSKISNVFRVHKNSHKSHKYSKITKRTETLMSACMVGVRTSDYLPLDPPTAFLNFPVLHMPLSNFFLVHKVQTL